MGDSGKALPEPRFELRSGVGLVRSTCEVVGGSLLGRRVHPFEVRRKETRRMEGREQPEGSPREKARVRTQSRVALPDKSGRPARGSMG